MTELDEILNDIEHRLSAMQKEQWDRYFNGHWGSAEAFLGLSREEEFSRRMMQLIEAKYAIADIIVKYKIEENNEASSSSSSGGRA